MGRSKSAGGSTASGSGTGGGGGMFLGELAPKVDRWLAASGDPEDLDSLVEHLRRTNDKYNRQKLVPFRSMVAKALARVQEAAGGSPGAGNGRAASGGGGPRQQQQQQTAQLEELEEHHLQRRARQAAGSRATSSGTTTSGVSSGGGGGGGGIRAAGSDEDVGDFDSGFDTAGAGDSVRVHALEGECFRRHGARGWCVWGACVFGMGV